MDVLYSMGYKAVRFAFVFKVEQRYVYKFNLTIYFLLFQGGRCIFSPQGSTLSILCRKDALGREPFGNGSVLLRIRRVAGQELRYVLFVLSDGLTFQYLFPNFLVAFR